MPKKRPASLPLAGIQRELIELYEKAVDSHDNIDLMQALADGIHNVTMAIAADVMKGRGPKRRKAKAEDDDTDATQRSNSSPPPPPVTK
jgi:hypothetical protein